MKETTQKRLNEIMSKMNLRQVDLLRLTQPYSEKYNISITKSHISQYVNGKSKPDQHKLFLLSLALNVSEAWLMGYDVPMEKEIEIQEIYNKLEQPRQEKVYNFAENELYEQNNAKNRLVTNESENMINYSNGNIITLYGAVSAGTGEYLEDNATWEVEFKGNVPQHDFALRVNGDSMQPLFKDNDIIFVKKEITDYNNKIVVASLNGEGYVKKFVKTKKETKLVSLNKKYDDVIIDDDDCLEVFGIVIK